MRRSGLWALAMTLYLCVARASLAAEGPSMSQMMADFGLPAEAAERILRGEMVQSDPKESADRELAVGLTFLVQQPPAQVLKAFRSALDLRADPKLAASVAIRGPGTLKDFASLVLEPNGAAEAKRYLTASPGDVLNLSLEEIQAFDALASAGRDPMKEVEGQLKQQLLGRYQTYLAKGLHGMAPYDRRNGPFDASEELKRASQAARVLGKYAPELQQLLIMYPQGKPAGLEESFYWLRYDLDGRPNYTLRHRLALPVGDTFAVVDREFYVTHDYNTSQAVAGLVPVSEGTVVFYRSRVSTDQVAGFGSSVKKGIGRGVMAKQLTGIFERSRGSFQRDPQPTSQRCASGSSIDCRPAMWRFITSAPCRCSTGGA